MGAAPAGAVAGERGKYGADALHDQRPFLRADDLLPAAAGTPLAQQHVSAAPGAGQLRDALVQSGDEFLERPDGLPGLWHAGLLRRPPAASRVAPYRTERALHAILV